MHSPVAVAPSLRMVTARENQAREFVSHEDPCRVLNECRACTLLDLDYRKQLQIKTQDFRTLVAAKGETFARTKIMDCAPSDARFAYRHTAKLVLSERVDRFHADRRAPGEKPKRWINIGLYRPGTHDVIDIGGCPVQTPHINSIVSALRTMIKDEDISVYDERTRKGDLRYVVLRTAHRSRQTLVTLIATNGDKARFAPLARGLMERFSTTLRGVLLHVNSTAGNAIFDADTPSGESITLSGARFLDEEISGLALRVSAESFFQVNPHVAERMYNRITELADLQPNETALDLYCGVGGISLLLAKSCKRVVGIEESPSSVADARHNAGSNQVGNAEFHQGRAEDVIADVSTREGSHFDVVTINPSRRGCQPAVLEAVAKLAPRRIVYMSCFADTLLRDAQALCLAGYKALFFEPFDMFPGTSHMEVLCVLDRT